MVIVGARRAFLVALTMLLASRVAFAFDPGEEVELSSAPVTALSCAHAALSTGHLELLSACPMEEAPKGFVVFDVADKQIYRLDLSTIRLFDLESAFAGGSVDLTGVVKSVDSKDGVPLLAVIEYRVTPRPKPGAFKGCL
jgi:hypothetical protein